MPGRCRPFRRGPFQLIRKGFYVSKELAKEIHVKAEPFIKCLKGAEDESSGGKDDKKMKTLSEVVYLKTAGMLGAEAVKSDNRDDDMDIDAI